MNHYLRLFTTILVLKTIDAAPVAPTKDRQGKNLAFFDYMQPEVEYNNFDVDNDDYVTMALQENDLSRTIPSRKKIRPQPYNSPIYYIRLPPNPYMFVPGVGYVSHPPPSPISQFVNLPVSFIANGKPSAIYQWSGAFQNFPSAAPPSNAYPEYPDAPAQPVPMKPTKKPAQESTIYKLPGSFTFNGKPEDIFVLRDSYNSLYNDLLQNVYP